MHQPIHNIYVIYMYITYYMVVEVRTSGVWVGDARGRDVGRGRPSGPVVRQGSEDGFRGMV